MNFISYTSAHRTEWLAVSPLPAFWSLGFVADEFFDGRRFRSLPVVDKTATGSWPLRWAHGIKGEQGRVLKARIGGLMATVSR